MQRINKDDFIYQASPSQTSIPNISQDKSLDMEKKAASETVELHPPPAIEVTVDPADTLDPKNWPVLKKRLVFLALMSSSILCDGYDHFI
jgi:hypothetical protein